MPEKESVSACVCACVYVKFHVFGHMHFAYVNERAFACNCSDGVPHVFFSFLSIFNVVI